MFLVIGSVAAKKRIPEWREPADVDFFTDTPEWSDPDSDPYFHPGLLELWGGENRYATLDELLSIKTSHIYWDLKNGSWFKHADDILALKRAGAVLIPEVHDVLYSVWEEEYGKKTINLDQDKMAFFDDAVRRVYDHDSVHYSVAYGDAPIYEEFLKDGESVAMDMKKVWAAPLDTQVRLFREEIYATALERWVIPSDYKVSPRAAYAKALKKTVTNLTRGRSAKFIATNLDKFIAPDVDYVGRHKSRTEFLIPYERSN